MTVGRKIFLNRAGSRRESVCLHQRSWFSQEYVPYGLKRKKKESGKSLSCKHRYICSFFSFSSSEMLHENEKKRVFEVNSAQRFFQNSLLSSSCSTFSRWFIFLFSFISQTSHPKFCSDSAVSVFVLFFNTHLGSFLRSFLTVLKNALCCLHWRDSYTCRNEYKYSEGFASKSSCSQKLYWSYSVELVKPLPFVHSALVSWPQLGAQSEFVRRKCSVKNKKSGHRRRDKSRCPWRLYLSSDKS